MDQAFIYAIMRAESNFRKEAISPVGARGLMQIMPYTAEQIAKLLGDDEYTDEKLSEPALNVKYGARYLNRLQKKFEGLIPLSAAGYNAGPHRVYSWLNTVCRQESSSWVSSNGPWDGRLTSIQE